MPPTVFVSGIFYACYSIRIKSMHLLVRRVVAPISIVVHRRDDCREPFALSLRWDMAKNLVRAAFDEIIELGHARLPLVWPLVTEQEIERHMKIIGDARHRLLIGLALAELVAVVRRLTDVERRREVLLRHALFFTQIAQSVLCDDSSPPFPF